MGGSTFETGVGNASKGGGGRQERGEEKHRGEVITLKETMSYSLSNKSDTENESD